MSSTPAPLEISATLSLGSGERNWGSERRMALLAAIATEGSISAAARKIGLSYKAAWDAVDMMNNLAGDLLVERTTGGTRGGGARLTPRAQQLVAWYEAIQAEHQRFMDKLARFGPDSHRHLDLLHSMSLQTSARNRFEGIIEKIDSGPVNDRLTLKLSEHLSLDATLTHASTERLNLAPGRRALAFIKAQAVHIQVRPQTKADTPADQPSAAQDNCWHGRVSQQIEGDGVQEVSLAISPQIQITGLAGDGHLPPGTEAQARFPATDVLIGTLD